MELSRFTDYSLRAFIFVAVRGEESCSVKDIAEAFGLSRNHMVKIVHNLAKLGYLETRRDRGGGLRLQQPPAEMRIGDIVRQTESLSLV